MVRELGNERHFLPGAEYRGPARGHNFEAAHETQIVQDSLSPNSFSPQATTLSTASVASPQAQATVWRETTEAVKDLEESTVAATQAMDLLEDMLRGFPSVQALDTVSVSRTSVIDGGVIGGVLKPSVDETNLATTQAIDLLEDMLNDLASVEVASRKCNTFDGGVPGSVPDNPAKAEESQEQACMHNLAPKAASAEMTAATPATLPDTAVDLEPVIQEPGTIKQVAVDPSSAMTSTMNALPDKGKHTSLDTAVGEARRRLHAGTVWAAATPCRGNAEPTGKQSTRAGSAAERLHSEVAMLMTERQAVHHREWATGCTCGGSWQ